MTTKFKDISNKKFGKLMAMWPAGRSGNPHPVIYWACACDCGNYSIASGIHLRAFKIQSCGCSNYAVGKDSRAFKHGYSCAGKRSPEYYAYHGAKHRCTNINHPSFHNYGGRGIEFKFNSFEEFLEEVGLRPSSNYSLDRINNNEHYEKGNIQWSTASEQTKNQRKCMALENFTDVEIINEYNRRFGDKFNGI